MTREEAQGYIREHATEYLTPDKSGKGYICPICGSGSGRNGTGITENPKSKGHFTCWRGCFENASIFDLIKLKENLTDFNETFRRACEIFGVSAENDSFLPYRQPKNKVVAPASAGNSAIDFREFYKEACRHIEDTEYHRGISLETLRSYWVGYIPEWRHPNAPNAPMSPRLIIPTNWEGYLARDTRPNLTAEEKRFCKQRAGRGGIWNVKAISESQQAVYVVEGEIDALSIIDVGGEAIALCSVSNAKRLIEVSAQRKPRLGFILALDNDDAGRKASVVISEGLTESEIPFCVHELPSGYKDANEFLLADRPKFTDWVNQGYSAFRSELKESDMQAREEFESESAFSDLGNFLQSLKRSREGKAIPTGFSQLDRLLDGGLYPGLYFWGAVSSLGKTSLMLQIADQVAKDGRSVLFFSLEMSKNELIAKSLSRLTRQFCGEDTRLAKTTRGILRADFNPAEQKIFADAVREYSSYASNIFISEGLGDVGVSEVKEKLDRFMRFSEGVPPVIVLDYVQVLAPADIRATDKQNTDKAVLELKRLSRDYQVPVIGISSFNRENYAEPVSMSAFKESGAIEYSSDVLIGLQYSGWDYQPNEKESEHKRRIRERLDTISLIASQGMPIDIECKILKHRNGSKGRINFKFHSMFNLFEEA